jgi:plasmid replication initiation protein
MPQQRRRRTYLDGITYATRDLAKAHGARWDTERKRWYVLGNVPDKLADLVNPEEGRGGAGGAPSRDLLAPLSAAETSAPPTGKPTLRPPPADDAQADFFVPALYDVAGKESRSTMDVAVFRLSKKDIRAGAMIRYELSDGYVEVKSGPDGMASVWDYDIVLMAISQLTDAMNRYRAGQADKPGRLFRPHISEILKFCRKGDGGRQVAEIEAALDRLRSTTIKIVRYGTNRNGRPMRAVEAEGLINNYRAVSYTDSDKIAIVEIELPNWIYRHVVETNKPDVLTVHRDYFLIEQGIARFLYRLARKAAGKGQARWSFRTIFERSGSTGTFKEFCRLLRGIIAADDLPEYLLAEDKGQDGPVLAITYRNGEPQALSAGG